MLYVPDYVGGQCVVLQNSTTIRKYLNRPQLNSTVIYRDYYINSGYIFNEGQQTFSQYSTLPNCRNDITTDYWYRLDIHYILICVFVICFILYFLAFKPLQRFSGRWLKW